MPADARLHEHTTRLTRRHLVIGWTGLLIFLTLGIVLEALHGLKAGYYLDTRNVTRRLMWTLAHTHGTLFSLVNIAFALTLHRVDATANRPVNFVSNALLCALVLLPLGFFLGGLRIYGGDPGPGIFLVPIGAVFLLAGVATFVVVLLRKQTNPPGSGSANAPGASSAPLREGDGSTGAGPAASSRVRSSRRQRK